MIEETLKNFYALYICVFKVYMKDEPLDYRLSF